MRIHILSVERFDGHVRCVFRVRAWYLLWLGWRTLIREASDWEYRQGYWDNPDTGEHAKWVELKTVVDIYEREQKRLERLLNEAEPGTIVQLPRGARAREYIRKLNT